MPQCANLTADAIRTLAADAAGNWQRYDSFAWFGRPDDAEQWAVVYYSNRDSDLLDQSNGEVIRQTMEPFTEGDDPDAVGERHSHWACGYVDGYSIRVYGPDGEPTAAFAAWCDLQARMKDYPVLDEEEWSNREWEDTQSNLTEVGERVARNQDREVPDGWQSAVADWFDGSREYRHELEPCDGFGGYPTDESIEAAFDALGWHRDSALLPAT